MSIEARIIEILKEVSVEEVPLDLSWDSNLQNELELDSMDILELYQGIQKDFKIDFRTDEIGKFKTISELSLLINGYRKAA